MNSLKLFIAVLGASCFSALYISAQIAPGGATVANRSRAITEISNQLQWTDETSKRQYLNVRDSATQALLQEVDGFITEAFQPSNTTAETVKQGLDLLMGRKKGDVTKNFAYTIELPSGRFVLGGVEVSRGGRAVAEDAVSLRAYRFSGNSLVFVGEANDFGSSDPAIPYLVYLQSKIVPAPVPAEFWFLTMADIPPLTPPKVAARLYAFNGSTFRTVWMRDDFTAESVERAIDVGPDGFTVRRLLDPTGGAALAPTVVVNERYILTSEGAQKVGEWESERK